MQINWQRVTEEVACYGIKLIDWDREKHKIMSIPLQQYYTQFDHLVCITVQYSEEKIGFHNIIGRRCNIQFIIIIN